ncbi:MAG: hypothetical protein ACI92Z_002365, partial [Paracoccaceae bacterium]
EHAAIDVLMPLWSRQKRHQAPDGTQKAPAICCRGLWWFSVVSGSGAFGSDKIRAQTLIDRTAIRRRRTNAFYRVKERVIRRRQPFVVHADDVGDNNHANACSADESRLSTSNNGRCDCRSALHPTRCGRDRIRRCVCVCLPGWPLLPRLFCQKSGQEGCRLLRHSNERNWPNRRKPPKSEYTGFPSLSPLRPLCHPLRQ